MKKDAGAGEANASKTTTLGCDEFSRLTLETALMYSLSHPQPSTSRNQFPRHISTDRLSGPEIIHMLRVFNAC